MSGQGAAWAEAFLEMMAVERAAAKNTLTAYSRDLIIEKLDEEHPEPGKQGDKSVYVVNPKGGGDSRVVADIRLVHE